MKHISSLLLFAVGGCWGFSLAQQKAEKPVEDKQNMTGTQQDAFYPKGEQALYNYVMMNVKYSEDAKKNYLSGVVSLSFDIMPDSSVTNAKIINDPGYGVGEEVRKIVEKLKFASAEMMGVKVKSTLIMDFPVKAH
jgi:outer membrane biosynthesis protein TonB